MLPHSIVFFVKRKTEEKKIQKEVLTMTYKFYVDNNLVATQFISSVDGDVREIVKAIISNLYAIYNEYVEVVY